MNKKYTACQTCGFPLEVQRNPVFLTNDVFSYLHYEENVCEECGHQKNGSSLPVVSELIQKVIKKIRENSKGEKDE